MTVSPVSIFDTCSRTLPSSWGTADSGHVWNNSGLSLSMSAGMGKIISSPNSGKGFVTLGLGSIPPDNTSESLSLISWNGPTAFPLTDFGPTLNNTGNRNMCQLAIQANWSEIALQVFSNGNRYEMHRVPFSLEKDTLYWVRFRVTDKMYGKIWKYGTREPSGWSISTILWNGGAIGAGAPGFFNVGTRDQYTVNLHNFAYYTFSDSAPNVYPTDSFEGRTVQNGWGISSNGHLWEGTIQTDPTLFAEGSVGSVSGGIGSLTPPTTRGYDAYLGKSYAGDMELKTRVRLTTPAANGYGYVRLGIRGQYSVSNNRPFFSGYGLVLEAGSNTIYIQKHTSGGWVNIGNSGALPIDLHSADSWVWVKFKIVGTQLSAKAWQIGTTEPGTWSATATDNTFTTGLMFFSVLSSVAGAHTFQFGEFQFGPPTPEVGVTKNFATVGSLNPTGSTDTTINMQYTYADDANNNATLSIRYKLASSNTWTTLSSNINPSNRTGREHLFSISNLQPETDYHVEVTLIDPDTVRGANPAIVLTSTLNRGIKPSAIYISDVGASSATIKSTYTRDTDNDSSAQLRYRVSSASQYTIEDEFVDVHDDTLLQNAKSVLGGQWQKHVTASGANQGVVEYGRVYAQTGEQATDRVLYTHTNTPTDPEYDVTFTVYVPELFGYLGVTSHTNTTNETYFGAGINLDTRTWELVKVVNGTKTVLASAPLGEIENNRIYNLKYVVRNAYRSLILNDVEILRTTDTSLAGAGTRSGFYAGGVIRGTVNNQVVLDSYHVSHKSLPGPWVNSGAMSVNRATKEFSKTVTGLSGDTIYEFIVDFYDSDGVFGESLSIGAMTLGRAAALVSVGVTPNQTTSTIDVFYDYDDNDNSYLQVQYRSTMESLWTVVPYSRVESNRIVKKFSIILDGLKPRTTYEIRVDMIDPDGLVAGTPSRLSGLFTTTGYTTEAQTRNKHYIWKFYNDDDKYIGTLPISPEPVFSIQENGGVTDLSFELPMEANNTGPGTMINFQNRIDVWAIDPSSSGMGPNLVQDPECDPLVGGWALGSNATYSATEGPDGSSCLKISTAAATGIETSSNPLQHNLLPVSTESPMVVECVARAKGSSLQMYVRSFDQNELPIEVSDEIAETVGDQWQRLRLTYQAPPNTAYVRVVIRNTDRGTMWADKFSVKAKEIMVYRGRIEAYSPKINQNGERVSVEALGLSSLLSDDYIEFLQFVEVQPVNDQEAGRPNQGAADPADMLKRVIDESRRSNPTFALYYTTDSIRYTGQLAQYTFRDQQIRSCMDKIRSLCPSGWHYFISADGLVTLRGPDHAQTHYLRVGVEIMDFEVDRSIRNLKNYVRVKGRQDDDMSEVDGHGSINYITFDQASIDKYGKRVLFLRDAQITDPETAKLVGDGRLDENNREEQRVTCEIPDEKTFASETGSLIGYNIESFLPGDNVKVLDPIGGIRASYWDQMVWDRDAWDYTNEFRPLPESVPIKSIEYRGDHVKLSLSERPPSQVGDYSRLARWVADKNRE